MKRSKYTDDAQRQDVLNALGLIRRNKRLRKVIEHRAKKVLSHFGDEKLKDLQKMIRLAVECRGSVRNFVCELFYKFQGIRSLVCERPS